MVSIGVLAPPTSGAAVGLVGFWTHDAAGRGRAHEREMMNAAVTWLARMVGGAASPRPAESSMAEPCGHAVFHEPFHAPPFPLARCVRPLRERWATTIGSRAVPHRPHGASSDSSRSSPGSWTHMCRACGWRTMRRCSRCRRARWMGGSAAGPFPGMTERPARKGVETREGVPEFNAKTQRRKKDQRLCLGSLTLWPRTNRLGVKRERQRANKSVSFCAFAPLRLCVKNPDRMAATSWAATSPVPSGTSSASAGSSRGAGPVCAGPAGRGRSADVCAGGE